MRRQRLSAAREADGWSRPDLARRRLLSRLASAALLPAALSALPARGAELPILRIGVLKFGTVSWELDVIAHHRLDEAAGVRMAVLELAGTPATQVALQAGRVDLIVSDWLWVSRQRAAGADWAFVPFSAALGALVAPPQSPIRALADLRGRRLGVAGSPIDKSWLILRLLAERRDGIDLAAAAEPSFGAPPLLDEELAAGRLDALLTYWPFVARLVARGMRQVIGMSEALHALGIESEVPMVGYVVSERWVAAHRPLLDGFLRASAEARRILATEDAEWQRLAPLTKARDEAELRALRDAFRAGIPRHWGVAERRGAQRLYALLAEIGGPALVGGGATLSPGTFLEGVEY